MRLHLAFAAIAVSALAACGGGSGGGGSVTPPGPQIVYANTALPYYLPLAPGNSWTFASGGKIVDAARGTLTCTCTGNGIKTERLDLFDTSGNYGSSFIFGKFNDPTNNNVLTTSLIGSSQDHGATISIFQDSQSTGITVINDAPVQGQVYKSGSVTSTITSVGQTQNLPDGRVIRSVASDAVTSGGSSSFGFAFAPGVGFTSVSSSGQTSLLSSFNVDLVNSTSSARLPQATQRSVAGAKTISISEAAAQLSKLF